MRAGLLGWLVASVSVLGAACVGSVGDPGDEPEPTPLSCVDGPAAGPSPIRRMTRFEYNRTVNDLLGDDTSPASGFGAEEEKLGFNNNEIGRAHV